MAGLPVSFPNPRSAFRIAHFVPSSEFCSSFPMPDHFTPFLSHRKMRNETENWEWNMGWGTWNRKLRTAED